MSKKLPLEQQYFVELPSMHGAKVGIRDAAAVEALKIRDARIAELEAQVITDELMTVEIGDGSTAVSDVYYGADDGLIAGVAFSKTSGVVGEIHPAATTDDLEEMFLRILSGNPDSLAVVKAAFVRAEETLRAALQEGVE